MCPFVTHQRQPHLLEIVPARRLTGALPRLLDGGEIAFLGRLDRAFREDRRWVTLIARCVINVGLGKNIRSFQPGDEIGLPKEEAAYWVARGWATAAQRATR